MTEQQEEILLDWVSVAVRELEKLEDDRTARILSAGGKALLKEINQS